MYFLYCFTNGVRLVVGRRKSEIYVAKYDTAITTAGCEKSYRLLNPIIIDIFKLLTD